MSSRFSAQIVRLCAVVAVPLLVSTGVLLYQNAEAERARLEQEAVTQAKDAAVLVERDLAAMMAALEAISSMPHLKRGDFAAFREFADQASDSTDAFVVATTVGGQQVVNTRVPADAQLPVLQDKRLLELNDEAVRTNLPVVSNYFWGAAVHAPLYSVRKAVTLESGEKLVVTLSRPVEHLTDVLKTKQLGEGGWITLIDGEGTIIARTIAPETIGRKVVPAALKAVTERRPTSRQVSPEGVPNFGAYQLVGNAGWTVAVAVPEATLLAPMHQSVLRAGALVLIALVLSAIQAVLYGKKMADAVRGLRQAARALGTGQPLPKMITPIREMREIGKALTHAQRELDEKRLLQDAAEANLRKAMAEAEWAVQAKSRFLAAASHDLRQPLQGLALYQGILRGMVEGEAAIKVMDNAETCVASLTALLNDMLDVNKFDAGAVTVEPVISPIGELMEQLVRTHQPLAEAKGLALRIVHCSAMVRTDPALLNRILLNFLTNAIRYTPSGRVLLGCRRQGDKLLIGVWDTGIGIPQAELESIFEEFYQLGNPERSRSNGTGLGLAIVKRAAALLAVPVRVRSTPAKGSMFAVEVPLADARPSAAAKTADVLN